MKRQVNWAHYIAMQAGVVPLSLGIPGVAKTASHAALARKAGRTFLPIMLDQCLPEDLGGFPVVRDLEIGEAKVSVMRKVLDERMMLARQTPSAVLVDELTNCAHSVQAAALEFLNNPPDGCWMGAAANPVDKAASGVDLAPPMVNRLCALEWETDVEAIEEGWRNGFEFPEPEVPILPADWKAYCVKWGRLLAQFRVHFPDLIEAYPQDPTQASQPWPSPRSWTNAGKLLAAAESVGASDAVQAKLVYGCVGQAPGTVFLRWLADQDLPNPDLLLANPGSLKLPRRGDMAVAVISSVFNRVRERRDSDTWEAAFDVLEVAYRQNQEVAMAAEGSLWKLKPEGYAPRSRNGAAAEMRKARIGA
jgi:hypothetical protein